MVCSAKGVKLQKLHFSEIVAFGPHGTGGGGAWSRRLLFVSATRARGRTVEDNVPSILAFFSVSDAYSVLEYPHIWSVEV